MKYWMGTISHANALAEQITFPANHSSSLIVGVVDPKFELRSRRALEELVSDTPILHIAWPVSSRIAWLRKLRVVVRQ